MTKSEHAEWAHQLHLANSRHEIDAILGVIDDLPDSPPSPHSYRIMTYNDTMGLIRQHPDVGPLRLHYVPFNLKKVTHQ